MWVLMLGVLPLRAGLHNRVEGHPQYSNKVVLPKVDTSQFWLLLDWVMQPAYP